VTHGFLRLPTRHRPHGASALRCMALPIWFHWTGEEFVFGGPPRAPKLNALAANPAGVAICPDRVGLLDFETRVPSGLSLQGRVGAPL
jgi:hypothetical protein